jgi:hypothetical protein
LIDLRKIGTVAPLHADQPQGLFSLVSFPVVKQSVADQSDAEVKNTWSLSLTPPTSSGRGTEGQEQISFAPYICFILLYLSFVFHFQEFIKTNERWCMNEFKWLHIEKQTN